MAYFQRVQVMGVTGEKPTLKIIETGPFARFSVAVDERWRNQQGESKKVTTWFRCSAFGKVAEQAMKQIKTGTWVFVEGRMRVRKLPDGREFTSITVDQFRKLMPGRHEQDDQTMPDYEETAQ